MAKTTGELLTTLKEKRDIENFLNDNSDEMITDSFGQYITNLLEEKKLSIAKVARRGQMSDSYLYKINEDIKTNISRDKAIQICFGFGMEIEESQKLLRVAHVGALYPRIRRDAVIMHCLQNHIDVIECDKMLSAGGDKTLLRE